MDGRPFAIVQRSPNLNIGPFCKRGAPLTDAKVRAHDVPPFEGLVSKVCMRRFPVILDTVVTVAASLSHTRALSLRGAERSSCRYIRPCRMSQSPCGNSLLSISRSSPQVCGQQPWQVDTLVFPARVCLCPRCGPGVGRPSFGEALSVCLWPSRILLGHNLSGGHFSVMGGAFA
ncbi:hypothetical protein K437DRAFT_185926 [Tilletiaria anomala UBC 951]|uniref:Uncharacterized protein n=1 Tax=Tilletiaria anomala (strain ATCC 24038 / CBS 436.72 / UBC 951) TaxID=1037660 RepID=A0A066WIY7_TILAU|nr:uncharacterized protein K437DRAFT_185926 [Tilletiaria anomala UBC 951]KDN52513.1 hypothetical protein K437DRAFT_185926 [Tilletiaria anomala UBC 951]